MKKIMLLALACLSMPAIAQKAHVKTTPIAASPVVRYELRGVVTYFFNENQGYKPDVGAEAFVIRDGALPVDSLDVAAINEYTASRREFILGLSSSMKSEQEKASIKQKHIQSIARVEAIKRRIRNNPKGSTLTADGQGVFTKKLVPGVYWVLIESANRNGLKMQSVVMGDDDKEVSAKFEADL